MYFIIIFNLVYLFFGVLSGQTNSKVALRRVMGIFHKDI